MAYIPETSDLWINSTRGGLQFKDGASPHSKTIAPSTNWYTSGEALHAGNIVSIVDEKWALDSGKTLGRAYKTDTLYTDKVLGIVLRDANIASPVEVQYTGRYYLASGDLANFNAADVGKKVYTHPTDGTLTTDRNLAASSSNIIEIGTISAIGQLDLHIEGDLRDFVDTTIFEYLLEAQTIIPVSVVGEIAYINPIIFVINPSTGKLIKANRATADVQYYQIAGIMVGCDATNNYAGGNWTVPIDTRVLVQRGGVLSTTRIKDATIALKAIYLLVNTIALDPGQKLYLDDTDGLYTASEPSVVYSGDTMVDIGYVKTAHATAGEIILDIYGPYKYRPDSPFPVGAIVEQPGATLDYGWLTCDGASVDVPLYPDLWDAIGETYAATYQIQSFTITAGASASNNITIDGETVAVAIGDTVGNVGDKIRLHAFTNWTVGGVGANVTLTAKAYGDYADVVLDAGVTGVTFGAITVTEATFDVPTLNGGGFNYMIRYSSYYVGNPDNGLNPIHRLRTNYASYTGLADTITLDLTALFSSPWTAQDIFVSLSMRLVAAPTTIKVIYPGIFDYAYYNVLDFSRKVYGYEVTSDPANANNLILNIGKNGIAYYNESGDAVGGDPYDDTFATYTEFPIDGSWEYSWTVYKAEQWNRFIDTEQDMRLQSLWQLGLIDLKASTNLTPELNQETGHLDRTSTNPKVAHTTRLNYDGNLYVSGLLISQTEFIVNQERSAETSLIRFLGTGTTAGKISFTNGTPGVFQLHSTTDGSTLKAVELQTMLPAAGATYNYLNITDGLMTIIGGTTVSTGGYLTLYGSAHASSGKVEITGLGSGVSIATTTAGPISLSADTSGTIGIGTTTTGSINITTGTSGNITIGAGTSGILTLKAGTGGTGGISLTTTNTERYAITAAGSHTLSCGANGTITLTSGTAAGDITATAGTTGAISITSGTASGAFGITSSGTVTIAGGSATAANRSSITLSSQNLALLGSNNIDTADAGYITLAGGGALGATRGGNIYIYGNEHASTGKIILDSGNAATSNIELSVGHSSAITKITSNTVQLAPVAAGAVVYITTDTPDASDDTVLHLCGGGATGNTRGAYISLGGNEAATTGGLITIEAGDGATKGDIVIRAGNIEFMRFDAATAGTPAQSLQIFNAGGAAPVAGYEVIITGDVQATTFNATSSIALKDDIAPFTQSALDLINNTGIFSYRFKKDTEEKHKRIGIIAEYSDEILSGKNRDSFDHSNALALALKAIQELSSEIKLLKSNSIFNKIKRWFWHGSK